MESLENIEEILEEFYYKGNGYLKSHYGNLGFQEREDILQGAVLKAYENLDKFRGDSNIDSWFCRILINETLMYFRRDKSDLVEENYNFDHVPAVNGVPSNILEEREAVETIMKEIYLLPEKCRDAVYLQLIGYNLKDSSKKLGCSESAVKSRRMRGKKVAREGLHKWIDPDTGRLR